MQDISFAVPPCQRQLLQRSGSRSNNAVTLLQATPLSSGEPRGNSRGAAGPSARKRLKNFISWRLIADWTCRTREQFAIASKVSDEAQVKILLPRPCEAKWDEAL